MGNRGFAITGILYTLFVLFVMILLSILATVSYKKGILEKSVLKLEDTFNVTSIDKLGINLSDTYEEKTPNVFNATLNAKYEFTLSTTIEGKQTSLFCYSYLKKGQVIPNLIDINVINPDFVFIPDDCNKYSYEIKLNSSSPELDKDKFVLTNVYKIKEE